MSAEAEIVGSSGIRPILDVAEDIGLERKDLRLYGDYVAKVHLSAVERARKARQGRLLLVTATTPTRYGEGKTVTTVGLGEALNRLGRKAVVTLRQPSLGPVFGTKGGAAGGGRAQLLPMEEINLHFTGDMHAVTSANNLITALMDAHVFHGNALDIDPTQVLFPRCLDLNDRQLRYIVTGLGGPRHGVPREDRFVITAASELMAILCLAEGIQDLRERIARVVLAYDHRGKPVTVGDLKVQGAATVLLKDALLPNLVQTTRGTAALVHGGPFGNIAHGHNTILADWLALGAADIVCTESGFGSDLGAEKFVDIVCPQGGFAPDAGILVTSVRALKHHGGAKRRSLEIEDLKSLEAGFENLDAHVRILRKLGLTPVVAVNRFPSDTDREIDAIVEHCHAMGVKAAPHSFYTKGGLGGEELARLVLEAVKGSSPGLRPVYRTEDPFQEKVERVAREIYGAEGVWYDPAARENLKRLEAAGLDHLPICIAKTQLSLTDDETLRGAPTGWTLRVRGVEVNAGAGFLVVLAGDIMRMPGLGAEPAAMSIDIDGEGHIRGLF